MLAWMLAAACRHVDADADPAHCATCHVETAASWSESQHARPLDDAIFARSWADTRSPWCLGCHQPEAVGVGCATCHGPDARECGECHQFDLPVALGGPPSGVAGQDTVAEWRRSSAAAEGRGCPDCHDPHRAEGGHSVDLLRDVLSVEVVRDGSEVVATLSATGVGHAVPTGDPFRRLRLSLCADLACRRVVADVVLERRLERTESGGWRLDADTRIPPPREGRVARRSVRVAAPESRAWRLTRHLADPRHEDELPGAATDLVATGLVEDP